MWSLLPEASVVVFPSPQSIVMSEPDIGSVMVSPAAVVRQVVTKAGSENTVMSKVFQLLPFPKTLLPVAVMLTS